MEQLAVQLAVHLPALLCVARYRVTAQGTALAVQLAVQLAEQQLLPVLESVASSYFAGLEGWRLEAGGATVDRLEAGGLELAAALEMRATKENLSRS